MYEVFERLCRDKGVRPSDVSKATGISAATLSSWKSGAYVPKAGKLQKIAEYFGVSVEYIMGVQQNVQPEGYYLNPETAKVAQEMFENKELRVLFDAARDASPEDLRVVYDMLLALKRKEQGNTDDPA